MALTCAGAQRTVRCAVKALAPAGTFEGYASVFGVVDGFDDVVAPGAFAASLARRGVGGIKMLWQHDAGEPIGQWEEIVEDGRGLYVRGRLLIELRRAAEAHALIKAGVIDGLSIGYTAGNAETDPASGVRTLTEVDLWEISLVTFQACPGARIAAVKAAPPQSIREFERFLREAGGYSHSAAKAIAAGGFKALERRPDDLAPLVASLRRAARILTTTE